MRILASLLWVVESWPALVRLFIGRNGAWSVARIRLWTRLWSGPLWTGSVRPGDSGPGWHADHGRVADGRSNLRRLAPIAGARTRRLRRSVTQ